MKKFLLLISLFASINCFAQVVVDFSVEKGPVKIMNAVNNGPLAEKKTQKYGNFKAYSDAGFSYARLHDAPICRSWAHTVDIDCIFPDFSADVNSEKSYDFTLTDKLIAEIYKSGTKPFYRLGQSIEHWAKKYNVLPPKDYQKWAKICEHIIRHYNEGWADGFHYGIEYWEIWNEPDLGFKSGRYLKTDSPTWNGSDKDFFEMYEIVCKYLKKQFPNLKVGGPALCEDDLWADNFLNYMSKHKVQFDFFSYHLYAGTVDAFIRKNDTIKGLLDKYGYSSVEMILDEWNYLSNWTDEFYYTLEAINSCKGAAFNTAVMSACQDGPADMLMYYDARPGTSFNGLFNFNNCSPLPGYYAMYSWKKLRALGTAVSVKVEAHPDVYATAAIGQDGASAILVTYYTDDKNVVAPLPVEIELRGCKAVSAVAHVTDKYRLHTEVPVQIEDGKIKLYFEPNSYALVELR